MYFYLFGQEIDVIAAWGALTGTTALILLLRQHLRDRANLVLDAELKVAADKDSGKKKLVLSLGTVNLGRRPIVIEEAGVKVPGQESADPKLRTQNSELRLPLPPKGFTLTEGQKQTLVMNPFTFELKEKTAVAFVRDTKGNEYAAEFKVIRLEESQGETKQNAAPAIKKKEEGAVPKKVESPDVKKPESPGVKIPESPVVKKAGSPVVKKVESPVVKKVGSPIVKKPENTGDKNPSA